MQKFIVGFICGLVVVLNVLAAPVTQYGPITSTDTAWSIATKLRPNQDVSVYQVLWAIFQHNKDAFNHGNMNSLVAGKVVTLPDLEFIKSVSKNEAHNKVTEYIVRKNKAPLKKPSEQKKEQLAKMDLKKVEPQPQAGVNDIESTSNVGVTNVETSTEVQENTENQATVATQLNAQESSSAKLDSLGQNQSDIGYMVANATTPVSDTQGNASPSGATPENVSVQEQQTLSLPDVTVTANDVVSSQSSDAVLDTGDTPAASDASVNTNEVQVEQVSDVNAKQAGVAKPAELEKTTSKYFTNGFLVGLQQYVDKLANFLGPQIFMFTLAFIVLLLLIFLIYLLMPRRQVTNADYPHGDFYDQDMNIDESEEHQAEQNSASKLSLARAYIEMGETAKARSILQETLLHGRDEDQKEAKDLLNKIRMDEMKF